MLVSKLLNDFFDSLDVKLDTKVVYRVNLNHFFRWVSSQGLKVEELSRGNIIQYKVYIQDVYTNSIYTVRNILSVVKVFYTWAEQNNIYQNIAAGIKHPKYNKEINKMPLSEVQVKQLLSSIDLKTECGLRDYCIVSLMIGLGLRSTELRSIDISDIIERNGNFLLKVLGKNCISKSQLMPVSRKQMEIINQYLSVRKYDSASPLIVSYSRNNLNNRLSKGALHFILKKRFASIGLTSHEYSSHSLRHTTATRLLLQGYKLHQVQSYMRHSSPITTEIYLKYQLQSEHLQGSVGNSFDSLFD